MTRKMMRYFATLFRTVLAGVLAVGCLLAEAKPLTPRGFPSVMVSLIPGDSATPAAVAAVRQLRQDSALKDVRFRILPSVGIRDADLAALEKSDIALVHNMGRDLNERIAPVVKRLAQRGVKTYAVGSVFSESEEKAGLVNNDVLRAYASGGGVDNTVAMVKRALADEFGLAVAYAEPRPFPMDGLLNPRNGKIFGSFADYAADYLAERPEMAGRVWVGVLTNRVAAQSGNSLLLSAITSALEARGFNVVTAFGFPSEKPAEKYFLDASGKARIAAIVGLSLKLGNTPERTIPVMKRLDVPAINAISLSSQNRKAWEESPLGLSLMERSWMISAAEFAGAIAPTVVATKERKHDSETGLDYFEETPVPERVERLAGRVKRWVHLRYELNANKRVAVIYYNYPPGKENIGAAYLNVLPKSLWQMLTRLEKEGYTTSGRPETEQGLFDRLHEHGVNIGAFSPGALEKLVRGGNAMLYPVAEYRQWFDRLPQKLRHEMVKAWGEPEKSTVMVWKDGKGKPYFVFPAQRFGNVVFAPQPARGWEGDIQKMYHDMALPPHHQYVAFYAWLQKGFKANAMIHVGTHATHEWLNGKEIGFTEADPGEVLVSDVPQLYPYIVDDVGEGLQAKRRGMAATISYMTPPFDKASLNKELKLLAGLIDDYVVATQKSDSAKAGVLADINTQAKKLGVLKDLDLSELKTDEEIEKLEHYLKEIREHSTPYGLHTFGVAPEERLRLTTAEAMLEMEKGLSAAHKTRRKQEISSLIVHSAANELDALVNGLAGRHIVAGPGNDPIRNPESLPTGRNLYGFDPTRMPPPGIWKQGQELADKFIADYRARHGEYPDRVVFTLWSFESMIHEGVTEAEILALMGVRPVWNERGRIAGVEVIPRQELGRPRVDVTVTPSGLYRDTLPNLMLLLDEAVDKVKNLDEADNPIRTNVQKVRQALEARGVQPEDAARMASVRIFTEPPGAYGTGVDSVIQASNTWKNESEVADVYFNRVGHLFGQGYWGERPGGKKDLAVDIFKMALKGAKATIISRASNLVATLDNDDVFQYLGASAMAVRQVDGKTPETYILNLADPKKSRHETLDKYMGREMRTRYTNPEWVKGMMKEGYAGARFVKTVADNLWGWQVTVPEAVDGAKWNEMYETYVKDRNNLGVRQMFRDAQNMLAYQAVVDKMLVAINKGYWKADPEVKADLERVNREVIAEAGVSCDETTCSSSEVTELAKAEDRQAMAEAKAMPAPNLGKQAVTTVAAASAAKAEPQAVPPAEAMPEANPTPSPAKSPQQPVKTPAKSNPNAQVEGFEVKEQNKTLAGMTPEQRNWALAGFAVLVALGFAINARRRRTRRI